jgi:hypothetical protein
MASNEQRQIAISTIPIPKLTALMNNFICNTITHLNKLSVKGDEKLAEFDKKLNDLEIMTTLLEAKLNSLPEKFTSAYPPLEKTSLDSPFMGNFIPNPDIKEEPGPVGNDPNPSPDGEKENPDQATGGEGEGEGGGEDMSPEDALENFLQKNEDYRSMYKLLKIGANINQVQQKVTINGLDMDIFNELITLARKVHPNIP